jgi:hypothetical protein
VRPRSTRLGHDVAILQQRPTQEGSSVLLVFAVER